MIRVAAEVMRIRAAKKRGGIMPMNLGGRARTPVRADSWQVADGAHGVTRPTSRFAFVGRL